MVNHSLFSSLMRAENKHVDLINEAEFQSRWESFRYMCPIPINFILGDPWQSGYDKKNNVPIICLRQYWKIIYQLCGCVCCSFWHLVGYTRLLRYTRTLPLFNHSKQPISNFFLKETKSILTDLLIYILSWFSQSMIN